MFDIRKDLFYQYQRLSLDFYQDQSAGKLISILTNDVGAVQMLITQALIQIVGDTFTIISSFIILLVWSWKLTFAILALDYVWLRRYTIAAFVYMIVAYSTFIFNNSITKVMPLRQADLFIIMVLGLPIWIITIAWMISRLQYSDPKKQQSI